MTSIHATCVALSDVEGGWQGVLLRGPSGAGKSDLALRLIDGGARLVADDQTVLERDGDRLMARAPAALAGRIEIRGLGIVALPHLASVPVCLVCDLVKPDEVPRYPDPATVPLAGLDIALLRLSPFEASATAKLRLGIEAVLHGIVPDGE